MFIKYNPRMPSPVPCEAEEKDTAELRLVARAISKHFIGLEHVTLKMVPLSLWSPVGATLSRDKHVLITGNIQKLAQEVRAMLEALSSKNVKTISWMQREGFSLKAFAELVADEKLKEKVKMTFVEWENTPTLY